jgi:hypothetical protein
VFYGAQVGRRREVICVKLSTNVGCSVVGGAIAAAAAWFYVSVYGEGPGFWQRDPIAGAWALLGGAYGIGVVVYAVLSFVFISVGALHALRQARTHLVKETTDPRLLPEAWRGALADTEFASLLAQLPGEELTIAPLGLLRVLRYEIWRVYVARLVATQLVTIGLTCATVVVARYSGPVASAPADALLYLQIFAALALTIVLGAWLLVDDAIRDLAATVSGIAASWEATLRDQPPPRLPRGGPASGALAARSDTIVAAIDKLAATIATPSVDDADAATPALAAMEAAIREAAAKQSDTIVAAIDKLAATIATPSVDDADAATPALAAIEAAVRESAAKQGALIGGLCETLTIQIGLLAQSIEQRDANAVGDVRGTSEALILLAAAVDRLADPLLRRLRLLDTADRRLLTVLRRQEEAVSSVGTKWSELVTALQAMSAGLDRFAQATSGRYEEVLRLQSGGPGEPMDVTEELQELLDEMSDGGETDLNRPTG